MWIETCRSPVGRAQEAHQSCIPMRLRPSEQLASLTLNYGLGTSYLLNEDGTHSGLRTSYLLNEDVTQESGLDV